SMPILRLRFRIATLLILTMICAIALALSRPFSPEVEFSIPVAATYTGIDEGEHACCHVTVTNSGLLPIWIAGHSGLILTFAYYGDPTSNPVENYNLKAQTPVHYTPLYRGQSAVAHIPHHSNYTTARLGVQFHDWRGRTACVWSDDFAFPVDPKGG
ncbi:hypothetical protein, partial [Novipirellula herctigrandis]